MKRTRLACGLVLAATMAAGAANEAKDPADWRPSVRWRGFNVLSMFIKGNRPDAPAGTIPPGFCYRNPQDFREDDFQTLQDWGMNFARIPLDYRYWCKDGNPDAFDEDAMAYLDRLLALGKRHGIHIQLNFHRAPGFMVARPVSETGDLWHDPEMLRLCCKHWAFFARRYRDIPNEELSFNLLNEPPDIPEYPLVAKKLIEAIRREDPKRFIVVDGRGGGRAPLPELYGLPGVGQAARGYAPNSVTYNENAVWPISPDAPTGVFTRPSKSEWHAGPLVLADLPPCDITLAFSHVSGTVEFRATADGREVSRFGFSPTLYDKKWSDVKWYPQWKIWQGKYAGTKTLSLPKGAKKFVLELAKGDWVAVTSLRFRNTAGAEATLGLNVAYAKGSNFSQRFTGWTSRTPFVPTERTAKWKYDDPGKEFIFRHVLEPWEDARTNGVFVMVGEFGIAGYTPHDVACRFLRDELDLWRERGYGWAMWGLFRDRVGVMDSGRKDFPLVDFRGHKLDRPMLDLLLGDGAWKPAPKQRTLTVDQPHWLLPIDNAPDARKVGVNVYDANGTLLAHYAWALAATGEGDWKASVDVRAWRGKTVTLRLASAPDDLTPWLEKVKPAAEAPEVAFDEPDRLRFHFTPPRGFMNDPNGLVYLNGEWRLLYQHAPFAFRNPWDGNQYWGYATSSDLVHWTHRGDAVLPYPGQRGLISGSGVIDAENTAGFGKNAHVLCVCGGSPRGWGLLLWVSTDGRTFSPYAGNPVYSAEGLGADPKVIWHAPTKKWIMVTHTVKDNCYCQTFASSPDLRHWRKESEYFGDHTSKGRQRFLHECPGLQELPIEGTRETAWVVWGAGPEYAVGQFDGHAFRPEAERLLSLAAWGTPYYAGQSFQNAPGGRCVYLPWYRIEPDKSRHFNQALGLPVDLALKRTKAGLRLTRKPVKELEALREGGAVPLASFRGELAEIRVSADLGENAVLDFDLRGIPLHYEAKTERLGIAGGESVPWPLGRGGRLALRLYLDVAGLEAFSEDGLLCWPFLHVRANPARQTLGLTSSGDVRNLSASAWRLKSALARRIRGSAGEDLTGKQTKGN